MPQTILCCDLARSWIDLHRLPENSARRIANDGTSIADALADLPPDTLVVFEGEADQGSIQWIDPPPNAGCDAP